MLAKIDILRKQLKANEDIQDRLIILGSEDFFDSVFDGACFDMQTAYNLMAHEFVRLSAEFPKAIICPGSMYISTPIPVSHQQHAFSQDNETNKSLVTTTCYAANIMPLYYNGELLRIIRKGECVRYHETKADRRPGPEIEIKFADQLEHLPKGKLKIVSYHEDDLTDINAPKSKLSGVCFLGKTLLPGEQYLLNKYFGTKPYFPQISSHEVIIDKKKFCILICGEFNTNDSKYVSTSGQLLDNNHYDFVLHSTVGGDIFDRMQQNTEVYIHSDNGNSNKVIIHEKEAECKELDKLEGGVCLRKY